MKLLPILQIIDAVILVILILLQERSMGLGGVFGGSDSGFYQARRGMEKVIFGATIVTVAIFIALAILQLRF